MQYTVVLQNQEIIIRLRHWAHLELLKSENNKDISYAAQPYAFWKHKSQQMNWERPGTDTHTIAESKKCLLVLFD